MFTTRVRRVTLRWSALSLLLAVPVALGFAVSNAQAAALATKPVNTVAPTISAPRYYVGQTVTATNGTWTGTAPITYTYTWSRCNSSGGNCATISGATAQTYALVSADSGSTVKVNVKGTNSAGNASASSAISSLVSAPVAPTNTVVPAESAPAFYVGQTVSSTNGTWTSGDTPLSYTYIWNRCTTSCAAISGATASTYTLASADSGYKIRLDVKATTAYGANATASSTQSATVAVAPAPVNTVAPVESAPAFYIGQTVTGTNGTWTGDAPITYTYQWMRCTASCAAISGANAQTYMLQSADNGYKIRLDVKATSHYGAQATASSTQSVTVTAVPAPVNVTLPTVLSDRNYFPSETITSTPGTWTSSGSLTYTYQWWHTFGGNWSAISGATGASYLLSDADINSQLQLLVTAHDASYGGTQTTAYSAASPTVLAPEPPRNVVLPTISAERFYIGQTATADPGTWQAFGPLSSLSYTYQWYQCDALDQCAPIAGATGSSYLTTTYVSGYRLKVEVTAWDSGYDGTQAAVMSAESPQINWASPSPMLTAPTLSAPAYYVGQTVTLDRGTWDATDGPLSYSYEWEQVCGQNVTTLPDTGLTHLITNADLNCTLDADVHVTSAYGAENVANTGHSPNIADAPAPVITSSYPYLSAPVWYVGQTVTADHGVWNDQGEGPLSYSYSWERCNGTCSAITGASGSTYTLTSADVGDTLSVDVTATTVYGGTAWVGVASPTITWPVQPVNTVAPTASTGHYYVGQTLTSTDGTWTGDMPMTFTYRWVRETGGNYTVIDGATGPTYTLIGSDIGYSVQVLVTAHTPYTSTEQASALSPTITVPADPVLGDQHPALDAPAYYVGQTVSITSPGTWTGDGPITYSYEWYRCELVAPYECVQIDGVTGTTYTLQSSDIGYYLSVKVYAHSAYANGWGGMAYAGAGSPTITVPADPVLGDQHPTLDAPAYYVGQTVTASTGDWTGDAPLSYSYKWFDCDAVTLECTEIVGITGNTYTLQTSDLGYYLSVTVYAHSVYANGWGGTAYAGAGSPTITAPPAPVNTAAPTISADRYYVGQTLTADPGTWTGDGPVTYSYQWWWCDASGSPCYNTISGATSQTYTLVSWQNGLSVRVVVTATSAFGATATTQSATTPAITNPALPQRTSVPAVWGAHVAGDTIYLLNSGTWTGDAPVTVVDQLLRCDGDGLNCVPVADFGTSYTLTSDDIGHMFVLRETATTGYGASDYTGVDASNGVPVTDS